MSKQKNQSAPAVTAATHRLSLEIARPQAAVWRAFTTEVNSWWPPDFYATATPQRMIFEVKPGGRLYEDAGGDSGLVWYQVVALEARNSLLLHGVIAPPFGGPATSLLRVEFAARGKSATTMDVTDSTFGCLGDPADTAEGWRLIFEGGFKTWVERPRGRA